MGIIKYFRKNISIKKQFFIFAMLGLICSFILSFASLIMTQSILDPIYSVVYTQNFATEEENKKFISFKSEDFKDKMDLKFKYETLDPQTFLTSSVYPPWEAENTASIKLSL